MKAIKGKKLAVIGIILTISLTFLLSSSLVHAQETELEVWCVRDNYKVDLEQWKSEHPEIKINYEVVPWERTLNQLILSAASGNAPDVVVLDRAWVPVLAGLGHLHPLDEALEENWTEEELEDFNEASWQNGQFKGTRYAVPFAQFGRALFYRADWFEEAGLEKPETWEDVINAGEKIMEEKDVWGLSVRGKRDDGTTQGWLPIFYAMGGELKNEVPQINSEAGVEALKLYQDLVFKSEIMSPDTVSFGSGEARGLFLSGDAAMAIIGTHIAPAVVEAGIEHGDFKLAHIPRPEGDMPIKNVHTGFSWAIHEQSNHKEEAAEFLKYLTRPEAQKEFNIDYMEAVRGSVYEMEDYVEAKPWVDFIRDDMKNSRPLPGLAHYTEVSQAIQLAIQEMLSNPDADPQAVAEEAQKKIDEAVGA